MVDTFAPTDIPSIFRTALLAAAQVPATNDLQKTDALNLLMRQWVDFITTGTMTSSLGWASSTETQGSDFTVQPAEDGRFFNTFTPGGVSVIATLPIPLTLRDGFNFTIFKNDALAGSVIITAVPGDTINGGASISLDRQGEGAFIVRTGLTTWHAIIVDIPVPPVVGQSTVCYVDPSGNNTTAQRGNLDLPFLTIGAALTASAAGDVIMLAPGTYTEAVAWLEQRSLVGSGALTSVIAGTLTLTAGATAVANNLVFTGVSITGAVSINLAPKTAGTSILNIYNVVFQSTVAFARDGTNDLINVYNTQFGSTLVCNFQIYNEYSCEHSSTFTINDTNGSALYAIYSSSLGNLTYNGAGSFLTMAGCKMTSVTLTVTDNSSGVYVTTGCNFTGSTLNFNGAHTWREYGCTFTQGSIGGTSNVKQVSFQRFTVALAIGANTVTLAVPLGATTYFVAATQLTGAAGVPPIISNKTTTTFDAASAIAGNYEFGVSFRP